MVGVKGNVKCGKFDVGELEILMEVTSIYDDLSSTDMTLEGNVVKGDKKVRKKLKDKLKVLRVGKADEGEECRLIEYVKTWKLNLL